MVPSLCWMRTHRPNPCAGPELMTTPSATATMGVPVELAMSMPWWLRPSPKGEVIVPEVGATYCRPTVETSVGVSSGDGGLVEVSGGSGGVVDGTGAAGVAGAAVALGTGDADPIDVVDSVACVVVVDGGGGVSSGV